RAPSGAGYQMIQSLYAIAAGGITGRGLGLGLPTAIPAVETDFVLSSILEELGLAGGIGILAVYFYLACTSIRVMMKAPDEFGSLMAGGIGALFSLQVLTIAGGIVRLVPLTGVTMPFVSYGGSSMVTSFAALSILAMVQADPAGDKDSPEFAGGIGRAGRRFLMFLASGFSLVALALAYYNTVACGKLLWDSRNPRLAELERSIVRGSVLARGGEVLAHSSPGAGGQRRSYSVPVSLSQLVGYSHEKYGKSGIEAAYNRELLGLDGVRGSWGLYPGLRQVPPATRQGNDRARRGKDIVLTIDLGLQRAAQAAMAGRTGAACAMVPATGEVLACVSEPGFDPGRLGETWDDISKDPLSPLLNRATQGLYPPGSAFKPLVALAALDSGVFAPDQVIECRGSITVDGHVISCPGHGEGSRGHGRVTMGQALAESCNVAFVQIACTCGQQVIKDAVRRFGFGVDPDIRVPASPCRFPLDKEMTRGLLAETGIGQGETLVTPLFMAQLASAIGMDGRMPLPQIVAGTISPGEKVVRPLPRRPPRRVSSPLASRAVRDMMIEAVNSGTARAAAIPGITVAGKTGTAENPHGAPHAWFIGFAPAYDPVIAVAVVVENGGSGGTVAAPVAREIMRYWIGGTAGE
ncbi:MAG TPA: FtsW/RodA/SpoVE family cell cycle protein, partial [Firmicutes bacterium]|nr:FtsW/RodA/SpoVE family cell cycle protein [Bacillota bacterium]